MYRQYWPVGYSVVVQKTESQDFGKESFPKVNTVKQKLSGPDWDSMMHLEWFLTSMVSEVK